MTSGFAIRATAKGSVLRRELVSVEAVGRTRVLIDPSFVEEPFVVCVRCNKKVRWINTAFRSAPMMKYLSWLKLAKQQASDEAVHSGTSSATSTEVKPSIASAIKAAQPEPAAGIGLNENKVANALGKNLDCNHAAPSWLK